MPYCRLNLQIYQDAATLKERFVATYNKYHAARAVDIAESHAALRPSRVEKLFIVECDEIDLSLEPLLALTQSSLVGRDRYGNAYRYFYGLPGVFIEPNELFDQHCARIMALPANVTAQQHDDDYSRVDLLYLSTIGDREFDDYPHHIQVHYIV